MGSIPIPMRLERRDRQTSPTRILTSRLLSSRLFFPGCSACGVFFSGSAFLGLATGHCNLSFMSFADDNLSVHGAYDFPRRFVFHNDTPGHDLVLVFVPFRAILYGSSGLGFRLLILDGIWSDIG